MNKKITTEDLAVMTQKGFKETDKQLEDVQDRLERIEKLILADHKHINAK